MQTNGSTSKASSVSVRASLPLPVVQTPLPEPEVFRFEIVTVTPEMAADFLKSNDHNRAITEANIARIAWEIQAGEWEAIHQPIAFAPGGSIVDGQHRLHAIIKAGLPAPMLICRYTNAEHAERARRKCDGGAKRQPGHWLELAERVAKGRGRRAASVVDSLDLLLRGRDVSLPESKVIAVFDAHSDGVRFAIDALTDMRRFPSYALEAFAYAYPAAPARIAEVAERVNTGAMLAPGSGALRLYKELSDRRAEKSEAHKAEFAAKTLRLLQAEIEGTSISSVQLPREEGKPYKVVEWFIAARRAAGVSHGLVP